MTSAVEAASEVRPTSEQSEVGAPSRWAQLSAKAGVGLLVLSAPVATIYLSFNNGGYFPNTVGLVAIAFCAMLVLRTTLAEAPFAGMNRRLTLAAVALAGLGLLQLLSSLWSHSPARSLDAYDRTFLYVLVFVLYGSIPCTLARLGWLLRAFAAAFSAVCLFALLSRVLPHVWPTDAGFYANRLAYPLGYWNALGMIGCFASISLAYLTCSPAEPRAVRVLAAALIPATATTMLLTYSRGSLVVVIVGLLVYVLLARPRGLLAGLIAAAPASAVALRSAYDAVALSTADPTSAAAITQGRHVAITVGLAMAAAAIIRFCGLWLDRWLETHQPLGRLLSRLPRRATVAVAGVAVLIVLLVSGAPGFASRQVNQFLTVNAGPNPTHVRARLTSASSNGRVVLWQVALREYRYHKVLGGGAGTYQTYSSRYRTDADTVTDAHSLYLQTLGETGIVGLALLLVALLGVLVTIARRVRGPRPRRRALYAALLAMGLAWAIHNAADWDWQMPAVTLWFFAAGGLVLSSPLARPREIASRDESSAGRQSKVRADPEHAGGGPRYRSALAVGWLVLAVAPLLVGFSYQRLRNSGVAFTQGNCTAAKRQALSSISLLAVRPQAYEILGYCDLQQAYPIEALDAMRKAVSYDAANWNYHYGLAIALAANGLDPRPEARKTYELDPRESLTQRELAAFSKTHDPSQWERVAPQVMRQGLYSETLAVSDL